ncbi:substrate-binding domain-containing protein [Actinomycetes bacterium KLBMP 9797]
MLKPALVLLTAVTLGLAACSSEGGKQEEESNGGGNAGVADTPRLKIAMITHEVAGDTFWDLVRKGAEAAAQKDNIDLDYSNNADGPEQANLVQNAVDSKVDGIAVTLAKPDALKDAVAKATAAGIPVVALNSGIENWKSMGVLEYFGQDERLTGEAVGQRLGSEGAKRVLCVIHEQGNVSLEARCEGVRRGAGGGVTVENVNVNSKDMPSVKSTITAKLQQDKAIDRVVGLGAPIAITAVESAKDAGSAAKVVTFDTNKDLVTAIKNGDVQWAVDQQPYLQGYLAIDSLWLYKTNGNIIGGGQTVLTGPSFVDQSNIDSIAEYANRGTR